MSDWKDEDYRKLNVLVGQWLPKHKYVSINANHGVLSLTLEFHITTREPEFTQEKLAKIGLKKLKELCPNVTLVSRKTHGDLNFRKNGENKWLHLTGFPPLDADGKQMAVRSYFEKYNTASSTKHEGIGWNDGASDFKRRKVQRPLSGNEPGPISSSIDGNSTICQCDTTEDSLSQLGAEAAKGLMKGVSRGRDTRMALLSGFFAALSSEDKAHMKVVVAASSPGDTIPVRSMYLHHWMIYNTNNNEFLTRSVSICRNSCFHPIAIMNALPSCFFSHHVCFIQLLS